MALSNNKVIQANVIIGNDYYFMLHVIIVLLSHNTVTQSLVYIVVHV